MEKYLPWRSSINSKLELKKKRNYTASSYIKYPHTLGGENRMQKFKKSLPVKIFITLDKVKTTRSIIYDLKWKNICDADIRFVMTHVPND